ncbi:hypothetical protein HBI73_178240 [Parastagonospora nodorum]|nr:hypothetical protein HBH51_225510 [Parastagonospora nodorum]KAH4253176.1 hypothetical protein HBI03_200080 [Parastagonospora nodorum]KAH4277711.1 hypothetical protein HBI04_097980 [Parastagonospora nodorum]KAH4600619.1 hypothetical protein HBH82_188120 [Parastagonospora nodorum]KAH4672221.1 hypothetical protein HBH78_176460 [Parastagonospora nodorum]
MEDTNLEPTLATLYQFLNIRYSNRHEMVEVETKLMNDIFELCHWSGLYGPRSVLAMTKAEWWGGGYDRFYADPIDISDIADFIHDVLSVSSSEVPAKGIPQNSEQEYRGIERLPNELLDAICHYLPTQSIIKLHRTSKTMIQKVRLDNGFWRSHFFTGSLHAHLWDLNAKDIEALEQGPRNVPLAPDWDWRSVAKLLATKQFPIAGYDPRLDNMPLGLWNRCRIWSIVEKAFEHDFLEKPFHGQSNSGTDASRYDDA